MELFHVRDPKATSKRQVTTSARMGRLDAETIISNKKHSSEAGYGLDASRDVPKDDGTQTIPLYLR